MPHLFTPLTQRGITFRNRVGVAPMCQYSATPDGLPTDWHTAHLGALSLGGAALLLLESTAVTPEGRITPHDLGLWDDAHIAPLARIAAVGRAHGVVMGVQLGHAGRKASTRRPWDGGGALPHDQGGWTPIGPTDAPFAPHYPTPRAMTPADFAAVTTAYVAAAQRADAADFDLIEIHAAHGYLFHSVLSLLSNTRSDSYGADVVGRTRFLLATAQAVRAAWPSHKPLWVRLSCTDWTPGGWTPDDSVALAQDLSALGVDLVDCSSGGNVPRADIPVAPGYQVPFAAAVRAAGVPSAAVGLITDPAQANAIITDGHADVVLLARAMLRNPFWARHAAHALGHDVPAPPPHARAY